MFNTINTPQDLFTTANSYFAEAPKTMDEVKSVMEKVQDVVKTESNNMKEIASVYTKASQGSVSVDEINTANKKAQDLMVTTCVLSMPGSVFMLPVMVKAAKDYGISGMPASIVKAFDK